MKTNGQLHGKNGFHTAGRLDWDSVRRQMAAATTSWLGEDEEDPDQELLQQVWDRRAAQLARGATVEDPGRQLDLVVVRFGREMYAIEVQYVVDIRPARLVTPVPRVPRWVSGVINVRGRILSAIDLPVYFGLNGTTHGNPGDDAQSPHRQHLIVVETPVMEVILMVDEVLAVSALPISQIEDTENTVRGIRPEWARGVAPLSSVYAGASGEEMLVVLNLAAILADQQLVVHEEVA